MSEQQLQEVPVAPIAPPPPPEAEAPAAPIEGTAAPATVEKVPEPNPEEQARSRLQRQRDAANRRLGQEKARADFLAAEIEKLRPKPETASGSPKLESFNDIEAYANAKAEFVRDQALKEFQQRQTQERTQQTVSRLKTEWEAKAIEAESKWEDFNDVVGELEPSTPLAAALMRADPAVAYHLGKHPGEAKKLAAMEPIDQLRHLGRLEARLEATPPVAQQPSKAPEPISPLSGKSPVGSDLPSDEDDMRTWIRKRNKQLGRK